MSDISGQLQTNLSAVRRRMADAARRVGRDPREIILVAVTKYVDAELASLLVDAGCQDLGESRPQELWDKAEQCRHPPEHWHLIGHLQRNKVHRTLPLVSLIHSVDSLRLLDELRREAARIPRQLPMLLEVNISGDASKHGFSPAEVGGALTAARKWPELDVQGLMAMASREGDLLSARDEFRRLRELRDQLNRDLPGPIPLRELSMGMSGDFEVAIEEGATIVRIGSLLFQGLRP